MRSYGCVIGGGRAQLLEGGPARLQRLDERRVAADLTARYLAELVDVGAPVGGVEIHHCIWAEGWPDQPNTLVVQPPVLVKLIRGRVGGAQDLDIELLEQRARRKLGPG